MSSLWGLWSYGWVLISSFQVMEKAKLRSMKKLSTSQGCEVLERNLRRHVLMKYVVINVTGLWVSCQVHWWWLIVWRQAVKVELRLRGSKEQWQGCFQVISRWMLIKMSGENYFQAVDVEWWSSKLNKTRWTWEDARICRELQRMNKFAQAQEESSRRDSSLKKIDDKVEICRGLCHLISWWCQVS